MYTRKQFKRLARSLFRAKDHPAEMRRYLRLCRRELVLKANLKAAQFDTRAKNPLTAIDFTAPLSVVGESSIVIVRAEGMALRKIPIAFELDGKGGHRGTSMETIRSRLEQPLTDEAILDLYEKYIRAEPAAAKFQKAPRLLKRIAAERKGLENLMVQILDHPKYNTRRFMVIVDRDDLVEAVGKIEPKADKTVLVAYQGKDFVVDGHRVPVLMGDKAGAQAMWFADLCGMLEPGGNAICLDLHSLHWIGWISGRDENGTVRRIGPLRYGYPGLKQETEHGEEVED